MGLIVMIYADLNNLQHGRLVKGFSSSKTNKSKINLERKGPQNNMHSKPQNNMHSKRAAK
ncbi:MAG: hypothetical protein DRR16_30190 [Candidatus Parabeggiatoa sp. nov. 3]|nr:MAG: hypothetical protein DRR00_16930 [Gammaproteobacteria bacterium]RKZ65318.1 MAG: hypothetical protein DRQ99_12985 [Gammaproteobacteria bacterium]RKZ76709.1 MAG: hypothetical protein DRR16_30190 [Gammaproteobacteria bacterium]